MVLIQFDDHKYVIRMSVVLKCEQYFRVRCVFTHTNVCVRVCVCSAGGGHVGAGGAPPAGETPTVETAAQGSVLHAETPAAQEA